MGPAPASVPVVDQVLPMTEIQTAHRLMERNETFGKPCCAGSLDDA
jgi:hypothetical protein